MYDIITFGSASVDVFVKTFNESIKHKEHIDLCYHLGEKILIDDLLFSTGGGGTNTAVAFSRLGLKTAFIGCLGSDMNGHFIKKELHAEKVDFLGAIKEGNSGFSVILPGNNDRTILVHKGLNNSLLWRDVQVSKIQAKWLYLSTMLGQSFDTMQKLAVHAKKHNIRLACNASMYLAKKGLPALAGFLKNLDILILNKEEAQALSNKTLISEICVEISHYFSGIIVITDASNAAYANYYSKHYAKKIKPVKVVDNTGAGDAFAAGFVYGIIKGKGLQTCLDYGHKEALSVLKYIGAKNNLLYKL